MTSSGYAVPPQPQPPAPRRHVIFAAISVAILSILVVGPIALAMLLVWAAALALAGAGTLNWIGALDERILQDAAVITAVLLGSTVLLATAEKLDARFGRQTPGVPTTSARPSRLPWVARHPWLSVAALALFIDGCLVPLDGARVIDLPATVLAAGVLTGSALLVLVAAYWTVGASWVGVRMLLSGARRSSFFAGAVTAGCLSTTLIALLIGNALTQTAKAFASVVPSSPPPACVGESLIGCSRKVLAEGSTIAGPRDLAPAGGTWIPEAPPSFHRCIEELHRATPGGKSARDDGLEQALRITGDRSDAEDIVHATMIAVCLGSERITEIRPYFMRSILNAAYRGTRRSRLFCPLAPEEPTPEPAGCIAESLLRSAVQERMEASAYDALCNLPPNERTIIELYLWENLSHADIARRLRCSEGAARKRYSRAMQALKDQFQQRCQ